jgi:hypothetical protein
MKSRKAYFHESYPDAPPYPSAQEARRYYEQRGFSGSGD